ncbi:MAG: MATE family efflux transporter [Fusobacteriaceae bacterium]|nr:MATE family efflux transporter [Fusobacteriaceae bacterium]
MEKDTHVNILSGPIWKQLLIFFFPILLGTFFQQIYNTTDTFIVGNFVGKEALAAVGGSPFYIINIFIGFSIGLSSGSSIVIAQFFGSGKIKHLSQSIHTSIAFSIIIGLILNIVMLIIGKHILIVLKVPPDAMEYSSVYLNIISFGFSFTMVYNMTTSIFRAIGDTKKPLYFLIFSCFTNIILDLLFVVVFKLGVAGVAIATVISQFLSAFLSMLALTRVDANYKIILDKVKITPIILKKIIRIGLPRGLQSVLFSLSNLIVQSSFNLLGTDAIAGWTVDGKVEQLFWMTLSCFGVAITVFTAQNLGAKKYDRVKNGLKICFQMTAASAIFLSILIYLLGPMACKIFTSDELVLSYASKMLRTLAPFYITYIGVEIIAGFLYGIGISFAPMIITATGICTFRILWVIFVVAKHPTLYNVIGCYPTSWILTSSLFVLYYLFSKKRKKIII